MTPYELAAFAVGDAIVVVGGRWDGYVGVVVGARYSALLVELDGIGGCARVRVLDFALGYRGILGRLGLIR